MGQLKTLPPTTSKGRATESTPLESKPDVVGNPSMNPGRGELSRVAEPTYPDKYHDWYVVATVNPSQFATSGYVHIFLAESVPKKDWMFAPERVGDVAIFKSSSREYGNRNQREASGATISGRVPLTKALLKKGKDINNIDEMEEYLKRNLHWRCALVDSTVLPLEDVSSLEVKVFSAYNERAKPKDGFEDFPVVHTPRVHRSITHGKLRGYCLDDD